MPILGFVRYVLTSPYWRMYVVGFAVTIVVDLLRAKRYEMSYRKTLLLAGTVSVLGFVCARMMYFFLHLNDILANGASASGMSFFGVVLSIPLIAVCLSHFFGLKPNTLSSFCAPPALFLLASVRIGCFFSGCCGGALILSGKIIPMPTQIIEAAGDITIAVFLLYAEERGNRETLYPLLLIEYGILRFLLEFLRFNPRIVGVFTCEHFLSLLCVLVGVIWAFYCPRRRKNEKYKE